MPIMLEDLRVVKTKTAIENAMIELIEIKGFSKIKMVDIAKQANVNRNTIYLHYESKEDIVISILKKAYGEPAFLENVSKLLREHVSRKSIKEFFNVILNAVENNIELYRILLTDPNLNGYLNRILKSFREGAIKHFQNTDSNRIRIEYILTGIYGVLSRWVVYAIGSKEEIVEELTDLIVGDLRKLKR